MKVYIEYQFRDGPYGGANQFLKTLRDYFVRNNIYAERVEDADCVLINHTNISQKTLEAKKINRDIIFVHRMDGPVSKHRPRSKFNDLHSFLFDKMFCEGSVFQSTWTKENCFALGYQQTGLYTIIHNAPNPIIFSKVKKSNELGKKTRLVTTSWSANWNKGFDVLQYLDEHLDFEKFEFTFIGRSPIEFKNICQIQALPSEQLAQELRKHDIFVAASRNESCSNSLIEAINCGLVVVARESGCYKEIIKDGGVIFQSVDESVAAIEQTVERLEEYQKKLPYYDIEEIGKQYYQFVLDLSDAIESGKIKRKKITILKSVIWKMSVIGMKVYTRFNNFYENHIINKMHVGGR